MREVCKSASSGVVSSPFLTVQRMQYYPSGLPWADCTGADYQNRKYNGKEFIEMHGYDSYDYHARHMFPALMRFTTPDPLAEKYYSISPYAYCANNPVRYIDPEGMDYWSTNNPEEIERFLRTVGWNTNRNPIESFDFTSWNHATDAEFTGNLTYNDESKTFYSSYGTVENGVFTKIGVSIKARGEYNGSASIPNQMAINWRERSSGKLNSIYPEFEIISLGRLLFNISTRTVVNDVRSLGAAARGFNKKGNVFIKGFGNIERNKFHKTIKPNILKKVGDFSKIVGKNPDIAIEKGLIILKGTGTYIGKTFQTTLKVSDFFIP